MNGDWGIERQRLKAKNDVKITRFELGGRVDSPDALVLPYDWRWRCCVARTGV